MQFPRQSGTNVGGKSPGRARFIEADDRDNRREQRRIIAFDLLLHHDPRAGDLPKPGPDDQFIVESRRAQVIGLDPAHREDTAKTMP